jgi:osmotically-inducible protein OsmY
VLRRLIKTAVPVSRVGMAMWAWHNRDELRAWAGFVATAAPKIVEGKANDVLAEARLRARLTADGRTRGAAGLRVSVTDGVATLAGVVDPDVHDVALDLATSTGGIDRVRDDIAHPARRSKFAFT